MTRGFPPFGLDGNTGQNLMLLLMLLLGGRLSTVLARPLLVLAEKMTLLKQGHWDVGSGIHRGDLTQITTVTGNQPEKYSPLEHAFTLSEQRVCLVGTNSRGDTMAIFSKKQSAKKSDDQPKVIVDGSLEAKSTEESPIKDPLVKEASDADATAPEPGNSPAVAAEVATADPAAPVPVAYAPSGAHEEIEPEALETPQVVPLEHRFGIDDAILLMRSLPADPNMSLVVRVVRVTLAAVNVSVEEIVADAVRKETRIKESITAIEGQIADLERDLSGLRREITTHQADLKETANVRERLHLADQYPGHKSLPPPITTAMPRSTPSKPFSS